MKRTSFRGLLQAVLLLVCCAYAGAGFAASLSLQVATDQTGGIVGPLNVVGDDFCPTATTPGCDVSAQDTRIRTNDAVSYIFAVQVDPPGDTAFIRTKLKPGAVWQELPGVCNAFNSSITGAGTAVSPSELYCDLGFRSSWAANLTFTAKIMSNTPNNSTTGLLSAKLGGANSATQTATLPADLTVTATPRLDVRNKIHTLYPGTYNGVSGVGIAYQIWVGLWDHDRNGNPADDPDPLLGNEMVNQTITITDDLSSISPNAYMDYCNQVSSSVYPYATYNPANPSASVTNAGSVSCSPIGPSATGSVSISISGADLSFSHIPTQTRLGNPLPGDFKVASFGWVRVIVPMTDIVAAGGTLPTTNILSGFTPTSITNQANFNGAGEDTSNNSVSITIQSYPGSYSQSMRCYISGNPVPSWCTGPWYAPPTNASGISTGDGQIEPEQTFVNYSYFRNNSFIGDSYVDVCSVFDTRYYEPATFGGTQDASRCHGHCGVRNTDYVIEYGTGYVDPSTSWRDAVTTPASKIGEECAAPASNWHTSLAAAQAVGPVTKTRMRRLTPGLAGQTFALATNLKAKSNAALNGVPNGTIFKTWGSYRAETTGTNWRDCAYYSPAGSGHATKSCGDRLFLSRATARIDKTTLPNDATDFIEAGGQVQFKLAPTFTSAGGSISDQVSIVDTLAPGLEYVSGSATQNGANLTPTVTGNVNTGQTLTWNLGTLPVNTIIAPILYTVTTPSYTPNGTNLTNTARIDASVDNSSPQQRSDTRTILVTSPPNMIMGKNVTIPGGATNTPIEYEISYQNGTNVSYNRVDVVDILPYNGDGRFPNSQFTGSVGLAQLTTQSNTAQFYISKDAPATLNPDPQHSSNALTTGSAHWCPLSASHTFNPAAVPSSGGSSTQCPSSFAQVTAVRIVDTEPLPANATRRFTVKLALSGNTGGDVYTNQAQGTADAITLSPQSPYASTTIIGNASLQVTKTVAMWDPNNQGLYAVPGNEVLYTILIENSGDGPVDANTIEFMDKFPTELEFWNGDIDAGGPDSFPGASPVGFIQLVGSGMTFTPATDLRYSTSSTQPTSFAACTPMTIDNSYKGNIRYICLNPKGVLNDGNPHPKITFGLRARIK